MKFNMKSKKTMAFLMLGIAAMFMASGALLNFFGSISGTANVEQAVTLDGVEGQAMKDYSFDGDSIVAGDSFVDGPYELQNNMDEAASISLMTYCDTGNMDSYNESD